MQDTYAYSDGTVPLTSVTYKRLDGIQIAEVPEGRYVFHGSKNWQNLDDINQAAVQPEDWLWFGSCDVALLYAKEPGKIFQFITKQQLNLVVLSDKDTFNAITEILKPPYKGRFQCYFDPDDRHSTYEGDLELCKHFTQVLSSKNIKVDGYFAKTTPSTHHAGRIMHLEMAVFDWKKKMSAIRVFAVPVHQNTITGEVVLNRIEADSVGTDEVPTYNCTPRIISKAKGGAHRPSGRRMIWLSLCVCIIAGVFPRHRSSAGHTYN